MEQQGILSEQVSQALRALLELSSTAPPVRENEVVNWFALECLLSQIDRNSPLFSPAQIGIEVAVPQLEGRGGKRKHPDVRKDLVVWPSPRMTCWSEEGLPAHWPMLILEFKVSWWRDDTPTKVSQKLVEGRASDIAWLQDAVAYWDRMLGFSVAVDARATPWAIDVARVTAEGVERHWWLENDGLHGHHFRRAET